MFGVVFGLSDIVGVVTFGNFGILGEGFSDLEL